VGEVREQERRVVTMPAHQHGPDNHRRQNHRPDPQACSPRSLHVRSNTVLKFNYINGFCDPLANPRLP
jgi:hypothetical protein